jgi:hypothetical protein
MKARTYGDSNLPSQCDRQRFLEEDMYNDLRWLFDAAVIWKAADERGTDLTTLGRHADVHTMHASVALARSIYEFFFDSIERYPNDARARHFSKTWDENRSDCYDKYFAVKGPANKRLLHPIYGRAAHSGGAGHEGPDHLNKQVIEAVRDLLEITKRFIEKAEDEFKASAQVGLDKALCEAKHASESLSIENPLL